MTDKKKVSKEELTLRQAYNVAENLRKKGYDPHFKSKKGKIKLGFN